MGKKTHLANSTHITQSDDINTNAAGTLLITGVPGWLGNRMIDILINGDRFGQHHSNRKVRVLLEPRFKGLLHLPNNYEIVYADVRIKSKFMQL